MPHVPADNQLADRRYVSVVLRLVLDQDGQMIHGELVGGTTTRPVRFRGWHGLARAVRTWLTQHEADAAADGPETL